MNIVTNESLIRRNANIGRIASLAGLLILLAGMILSFQSPESFGYSLAALLVGFSLSQIGIYFANRWGRRPRPDELLNQALKGLNRSFALYHYSAPASHLLVGPAGIWVILPRHQRGVITYEKGRWRQKGGGFRLMYMKMFAQEGLGRPDLEVEAEVQAVRKFLDKNLPEDEIPPVEAMLVFTNELAQVQADEAPIPTLPVRKLKEFVRAQAKEKRLALDKAQRIRSLFEEKGR